MNESATIKKPHLIVIVDDEDCVRESLTSLLRSAGYATRDYSSAESFLASKEPETAACLVLDLHLPGMSGLDLQALLTEGSRPLPIVFISSNGTPEQRKRAIQHGAVAFLSKPSGDDAILQAVQSAIARSDRNSS